MPTFTASCSTGSLAKASRPMNRLMVKPMPHSSATPSNCGQLAPTGMSARPRRMVRAALPNTPISLPSTRPSATPSVRWSSSISAPTPAKDTPALAKPNTGMTRKATQLCRPCSSRCSGEPAMSSGRPGVGWRGMVKASATPAMVACTPERSTRTHKAAPSSR